MKKMLILKASEDVKKEEILNVVSQANMFRIETDVFNIDSYAALHKYLRTGKKYDYIYLATHGCEDYWGNISGTVTISWVQFAASICTSDVLTPGAIFFHSCCRGGLNQVAYSMFAACPKIEFVCGPRVSVHELDLITVFNLFLYNVEWKRIDPVRAAEKVLAATDIRLACFDKVEVSTELSYQKHVDSIDSLIDEAFAFVEGFDFHNTQSIVVAQLPSIEQN